MRCKEIADADQNVSKLLIRCQEMFVSIHMSAILMKCDICCKLKREMEKHMSFYRKKKLARCRKQHTTPQTLSTAWSSRMQNQIVMLLASTPLRTRINKRNTRNLGRKIKLALFFHAWSWVLKKHTLAYHVLEKIQPEHPHFRTPFKLGFECVVPWTIINHEELCFSFYL